MVGSRRKWKESGLGMKIGFSIYSISVTLPKKTLAYIRYLIS